MRDDVRDTLPVIEHEHRLGIQVDGLKRCVIRNSYNHYVCGYEEYDSQWGAGLFNDWPVGHHKPYGA